MESNWCACALEHGICKPWCGRYVILTEALFISVRRDGCLYDAKPSLLVRRRRPLAPQGVLDNVRLRQMKLAADVCTDWSKCG
jgi:hypothetical protein